MTYKSSIIEKGDINAPLEAEDYDICILFVLHKKGLTQLEILFQEGESYCLKKQTKKIKKKTGTTCNIYANL